MTERDPPRTLLERYDEATVAPAIVVTTERRTTADYLIAAGLAQQGDPRNRAALALYRLDGRVSGAGVDEVRRWAVPALASRFARGRDALRPAAAREVFEIVLHWYLEGVCPHCEGRRFELLPGAPVVGDQPCEVCDGRGKEPVHHRLPRRHGDAGRWLADQFGNMLSFVEADMARRLRSA